MCVCLRPGTPVVQSVISSQASSQSRHLKFIGFLLSWCEALTFRNAEAAFQALKFWSTHAAEFAKSDSGEGAFQLKKKLELTTQEPANLLCSLLSG